jgi:glyoxylase-like metal-dependent hydrolase (beta-lactamase superfamily II)
MNLHRGSIFSLPGYNGGEKRHYRMEIIRNVHLIPGVIANPYLIVDPDGLTLIDTGLPGSGKKILGFISGLGFSPADLKRIIITHADFDHVGGLSALKKASGARVYASPIESKAMAAGRPSRELKPDNILLKFLLGVAGRLVRTSSVQVDELLSEGQVLPVLGGLRVLETPGHTPGHISLFAEAAGILFVGDSLVADEDGLSGSVRANTWDETMANEAVKKQAALSPRIVCSGHGPVVRDAAGKFPNVS